MSVGDIWLCVVGDTPILLTPLARKFSEETIQLAREDRTSSGRMVRDVIATKKRFTLEYSTITTSDLKPILCLYKQHTELELTIAYEDSTSTTNECGEDGVIRYTVLMQPIQRTRMLLADGGLWENVQVTLDEV